ncbi:hypothetical protein LJC20_05010 [Eubacteriales bacterium OttesenSCG-928-M02]|nr:hypothetical protein [Eubacteriales bacterium OttesenSCG-928-M02]
MDMRKYPKDRPIEIRIKSKNYEEFVNNLEKALQNSSYNFAPLVWDEREEKTTKIEFAYSLGGIRWLVMAGSINDIGDIGGLHVTSSDYAFNRLPFIPYVKKACLLFYCINKEDAKINDKIWNKYDQFGSATWLVHTSVWVCFDKKCVYVWCLSQHRYYWGLGKKSFELLIDCLKDC